MSTTTTKTETITLHDSATGDEIRELTAEETSRYLAEIADDTTGTGAVDGAAYGCEGRTVYAQ